MQKFKIVEPIVEAEQYNGKDLPGLSKDMGKQYLYLHGRQVFVHTTDWVIYHHGTPWDIVKDEEFKQFYQPAE